MLPNGICIHQLLLPAKYFVLNVATIRAATSLELAKLGSCVKNHAQWFRICLDTDRQTHTAMKSRPESTSIDIGHSAQQQQQHTASWLARKLGGWSGQLQSRVGLRCQPTHAPVSMMDRHTTQAAQVSAVTATGRRRCASSLPQPTPRVSYRGKS